MEHSYIKVLFQCKYLFCAKGKVQFANYSLNANCSFSTKCSLMQSDVLVQITLLGTKCPFCKKCSLCAILFICESALLLQGIFSANQSTVQYCLFVQSAFQCSFWKKWSFNANCFFKAISYFSAILLQNRIKWDKQGETLPNKTKWGKIECVKFPKSLRKDLYQVLLAANVGQQNLKASLSRCFL